MRSSLEADKRRREGKDNDRLGPPPLENFGFYLPFEYVETAVLFLREFSSWPESGGWSEQDWRLIEDIKTYTQLESRLLFEVEKGITDKAYVQKAPKLRLE